MLPKWHVLFGLVLSLLAWLFLNLSLINSLVFFLSSVLIDFDHYLFYILRKKDFNLKRAYFRHKALPPNHKPMVQIFHTVEFILVTALLYFIWKPFIFMFIGLVFHSIIDVLDMYVRGCDFRICGREFSLLRYLLSKDKERYF